MDKSQIETGQRLQLGGKILSSILEIKREVKKVSERRKIRENSRVHVRVFENWTHCRSFKAVNTSIVRTSV